MIQLLPSKMYQTLRDSYVFDLSLPPFKLSKTPRGKEEKKKRKKKKEVSAPSHQLGRSGLGK